ncbi:hypothetical protein [Streptomyces sp. NPDC101237]|uniref:hypothetical protein n=1 Tax=Streptomyces sp. NPDC101237 TaxID=3366139 RepID=UPI00380ED9EC
MVAFAWAATHPEEISHPILVGAILPGLGLEEVMKRLPRPRTTVRRLRALPAPSWTTEA